MKDLETIAQSLNGRPQVDGSYMCYCPAHDDGNPSLSLSQNGSEKILFHCHAGCKQEEVLAAFMSMGLWSGDDTEAMSEQGKARLVKQSEAQGAERDQQAKQAALLALKIWQAAENASPEHPYLLHKQVSPVETLHQVKLAHLEGLIGYKPKANGEKFTDKDILVVPIIIENDISTLEFIDSDGRKSALAYGKKKDGYWTTEKLPLVMQDGATLLIGEGVATVLSCSQVSGLPGVASLSSGNLLSVAKQMRECHPKAELIILADLEKKTGNPDPNAVAAAQQAKGRLAAPDFGDNRLEGSTDFNDLLIQQGPEAVKRAIDSSIQKSAVSPESVKMDNDVIAQLAALSQIEYDRKRKEVAKQMGVRVEVLDKLVKEQRKSEENNLLSFGEVQPWEGDFDPAKLIFDLTDTVKRFVVCSDETARAVSLWIIMTWFIDVVQVAPLAIITAPEKRCGKSVLLNLIRRLVLRPIAASNISTAAVFRTIEKFFPTLILDEADTWMKTNEDLQGVINSGHTRENAYVLRLVGDNHEPTKFSTWGAKALAGISAKNLAATLTDRAILLELRRKLPGESIERLRHADPDLFLTLTAQLARFAEDYRETVSNARPNIPFELNDRAQDNWEPLLAIADAAGGSWPELARETALVISREEEDTRSIGVELLSDIQDIFNKRSDDRISTANLIIDLCREDERPWATYNRGFQISPRQIAARLGDFGIKSSTVRTGGTTAKGYKLDQFIDSFDRYLLQPDTPDSSVTESHYGNRSKKTVTSKVTDIDPSKSDYIPFPDSQRITRQV